MKRYKLGKNKHIHFNQTLSIPYHFVIIQERKEANDKKIQELKEAAAASGKAAKPGSLADKVGMVSRYNEVNDKRK